MLRALALGLVALHSMAGFASEQDKISDEEARSIAREYARCVAVWDWSSALMRAGGKHATAEHLHNMGNGARTAAYWILSAAHSLNHADESAKRLGDWEQYVTPIVDAELTRLRAQTELDVSFESDIERCTELSKGQATVIDMLRSDYVK